MKTKKIHIILLCITVIVSKVTFGQIQPFFEENNLKFQEHFFEALKQKAIGNYSKAVESLEICYEIDRNNKAVEFEFSKNYLELKKFIEAEVFIDKALSKDAENKYLLLHKVQVLIKQGNFSEAIEVQQKIVQKYPKQKVKLVRLFVQNKQFEDAEKLIAEIEKNALSTPSITGFKRYLENRKKLFKTVNETTDVNNSNDDISALKKEYLAKKEFKILEKLLNKEAENQLFEMLNLDSAESLELFPSQPFIYKMNGLALNKLGKYNEAITVLTLGIDFVIDNIDLEADFYEQLSKSYEGLNNTKEALKYKQKAEVLRKRN